MSARERARARVWSPYTSKGFAKRRYFRVEGAFARKYPNERWNQQLNIIDFLQGLAVQYGYPGVFVISVLGSAIPFVPLPYLAIVVLLSSNNDPLLLGLAAGAGGAVGKVTSYVLGRFGYLTTGEKNRRNLNAIHDLMAKYGMIGVFIFAVTPLPDDVYVIPMGIVRLPFWRFFAANLAGKVTLAVAVAYLGRAYFSTLSLLFGGESLITLALVIVSTVILSVLIIRSDWVLATEIIRTRGLRALLSNLRKVLRI